MQYRTLAKTDIEVSAVAFGCWAIVGGFTWGEQDEADSLAALRAAYDAGVTLFDTAEGYGNGQSERLIAKALADVRDQIVIATKASPEHFAPDDLRAACERSLRNLNTDRIDLYQLHWPNHEIPLAETLGVLEELKQSGKIRAYGVSNFGRQDLSDAVQSGYAISSDQLSYNLLFRAVEHEIQPLCVEHNVSILCYSPLMQALLTGKFANADEVPDERARTRHFSKQRPLTRHGEAGLEAGTFATVSEIRRIADELGVPMADLSLAWLLHQPAVTAVLAGGRNADQARRNVQAAGLTLTPDVLARLGAATDGIKQKLGTNADMWQNPSRIR